MEENEFRFVVRYSTLPEERYLVFVVDKFNGRIVYRANTKDKQKEYGYIKRYYGKENCSPPPKNPVNIADYD